MAAVLSLDGSRLIVGAPHHDYNSTTREDMFLCEECGGLFLYGYNGTDWVLTWFFHGDTGENVGDHASLSPDGSRVAIR